MRVRRHISSPPTCGQQHTHLCRLHVRVDRCPVQGHSGSREAAAKHCDVRSPFRNRRCVRVCARVRTKSNAANTDCAPRYSEKVCAPVRAELHRSFRAALFFRQSSSANPTRTYLTRRIPEIEKLNRQCFRPRLGTHPSRFSL